MNTYARNKIKELGLFTTNNSRGDYNGTGYGDYGQKVEPSMPIPQRSGGQYGWMPDNPDLDEQFRNFANQYGLNIPPGTKSLYLAPPSGQEQYQVVEDSTMQPVGQSMRSSKRPGVLLKPQTPMMDNSGMQQRAVQKTSKGFGTLPNMSKKPMGYQVEPTGWINQVPGGSRQFSPQDLANLESGFSAPRNEIQQLEQELERIAPRELRERIAQMPLPQRSAQQQPMPQYPQPVAQTRPTVDVDQLIDHWNNIQGPKAPLAHFIEQSKRSAGELPSFIPPDAQAIMNSPSGGPTGAPGGYSQPDTANPMIRDVISRFFMNGMRGNNNQMNNQERMINQRSRINQVDSMVGNVGAPVMGGLMSMFTGGAAGNDMAQDWNNKAYQRGSDLMSQRNQFINNAQQNTRDGFSMKQSADPNTMKNQISMMNAQANAQRANSYGQQVGNQGALGAGNLDWKNRELTQRGSQFTAELQQKAAQMQQQMQIHKDNLAIAVRNGDISQQQANQQWQIAQMNNQRQLQQMSQQMQIATMGNAAQIRGQDFSAYNTYVGNQGANMRQAAALHWDKDGNSHPATDEWFRQMFGAPAQPVQQTPVEAPNPISQFFGLGGQPQQAQNPVMNTALQHYQSLPSEQRAALRPQFIQKFGQDPGN